MSSAQTVIYLAHTMDVAHRLRNLLAEQRIVAVVLTDAAELAGASDPAGQPAVAAVVVAEADAARARQAAVRFHGKLVAAAPGPSDAPAGPTEDAAASDAWPVCPGCHARRSTRCPICHTAGTDFPRADMGFVWIPGPDQAAADAASCRCGPGEGCREGASGDVAAEHTEESDETPPVLLICPTCDEPFRPIYPRRCEWCGHQFPDGVEFELPADREEHVTSRVLAVIFGLLVLLSALALYFLFVLRDGPGSP